jgi:2-octaprenylphenol hydroxylase
MNHDVAVVGGGVVGLTLACALGRVGVRVALIEARDAPLSVVQELAEVDQSFDVRTSAITPVSQRILNAIGAWQRLPAMRLGVFEQMRVWESQSSGQAEVHFNAADADLPVLGHIVENRELVKALEQCVATLDTVQTYRPATLQALHPGPHSITLELDKATLEVRLVAGADGTRSRVRELSGIEADIQPYHQSALVATVRTSGSHQNTAWQRFLPDGPLAFLPLPDNWSSVVWSTRPEYAVTLERMDETDFANALTDAYQGRLGMVDAIAQRACFELTRVSAQRYLAPRVALLGDAAHTIHPLAGQGVNLGLLDAAVLAEQIHKLIEADRDPGLEGNLRAYERSRRAHNLLTGELMSGFNRLFGARHGAVSSVRQLGFNVVNRLPVLKRLCINYASGFAFDLPELAKPDGSTP